MPLIYVKLIAGSSLGKLCLKLEDAFAVYYYLNNKLLYMPSIAYKVFYYKVYINKIC
jgi:hypothetical protein